MGRTRPRTFWLLTQVRVASLCRSAHFTKSFLKETQIPTIETAFEEFTSRKDIAILLINQHVRSPNMEQLWTEIESCSRSLRRFARWWTSIKPLSLLFWRFRRRTIPTVRLFLRTFQRTLVLICLFRSQQGFDFEARPEALWRMIAQLCTRGWRVRP